MSDHGRHDDDGDVAEDAVDAVGDLLEPDDDSAAGADMPADAGDEADDDRRSG